MRFRKLFVTFLTVGFFCVGAFDVAAQRGEIRVEFTEPFFDSILDAVFQNAGPIEFSLAGNRTTEAVESVGIGSSFATPKCAEVVRILRESGNVRTSVRFREGKIYAPLAFTGSYSPPLVGCMDFTGTADSIIELTFDEASQRLLARAKVTSVSLNGTGGFASGLVARMVQGTIDKKINPIEIVTLEKMSFVVPIQKSPGLRVKASGIRYAVTGNTLSVFVAYEFLKA